MKSGDSGSTRRPALVLGGAVLAVVAVVAVAVGVSVSGTSPSRSGPTAALGAGHSPPVTGTVSVGTRRFQVMQGFGASGAWVGSDLVHFPESVQRKLGAMLFGRRGIALSGFRYNLGGGGVGVTEAVRGTQSFLTSTGTYDWSADPGGRALLHLAVQHGVPELTAFVNSAPSRWTTNGRNCGGSLRSDPASLHAYADYLATVVRHLRQAEGTTFSWVSPMNEPDDSFPGCAQEGMAVPVGQRAAVVQDVGRALMTRAPWARVIADESATSTIQLVGEAPGWLLPDGTSRWLAALAAHGYGFPGPGALTAVRSLGDRVRLPVWATEVCCYDGRSGPLGFGRRFDPTMASGMWLADTVWQDLAVADESAFYWWSAASPSLGCDPATSPSCPATVNADGWDDGLLYYDPRYAVDGNYRLYTTKRFYVMGNFARYVPPGSVRLRTRGSPNGIRALAFAHGRDRTVILIDDRAGTGGPSTVGVNLAEGAEPTGGASTSATRDLAPVRARRAGAGFAVTLPPQSVTTLTFRTSG